MTDVLCSNFKKPGRAASFQFCPRRLSMRSAAHKLIATLLVVLLAALGCFAHFLHAVTHHPAQHAARGVHSCCHQTQQGAGSNEESPTNQHDPVTCTVCRHLALSQLSDTQQQIFCTALFTPDDVVVGLPSVTCPSVTLVPIRGPPRNELAFSC